MILRGSSGLPKISRVGFKTVDISEGCAGSADAEPADNAEPATGGAEPAADGAGSGETVARGVGKAGARAAERSFEVSDKYSDKNKGRILIIFLISSFLKSLRINPLNSVINNFKIFIIIIIFFKNSLNFFKSK